MEFAMHSSYWSEIENITPFFPFVNAIVTYLEVYTVPLSSVGRSFALLYQACATFGWSDSVIALAKRNVKQRFTAIVSDTHALAVALEQAVAKLRWANVCHLYDKPDSFLQGRRRAFSNICQYMGFDAEAKGCFEMAIADKGTVFKRRHV